MYADIAEVYTEIFPLNAGFLAFIRGLLPRGGMRLLDLGCGPGHYVRELATAHTVTGIDSDAGVIALAQEVGGGDFLPLSFAGIAQLPRGYDGAYCIGNSLSYLPEQALPEFLRGLRALLVPGGFFLLQLVNWDAVAMRGGQDFPVKHISGGRSFHRRYELQAGGSVLFFCELRRGQEVLAQWCDTLHPKRSTELVEALREAGFAGVELYGDYQKAAFEAAGSPALIVLARRS